MKKSIILSILALIAVFAALLIFSGDERSKKKEAPPPTPEMAKAPEQPAPPVEETPPAEDPALKDALLGSNEEPRIEESVAPAPRKIRRRARPVEQVEDEPQEELELGLSDYAFQSAVGNWSGVKSCLATNSQRREDRLTGAIQVAFTIRGDGEVRESKVVGVSNEDAATVAPCVEKQARHIRFPAFAGNEDVTKTAKFVF